MHHAAQRVKSRQIYSNLDVSPQAWARRTIGLNAIRPKYARAAMAVRLPKSADIVDFFRKILDRSERREPSAADDAEGAGASRCEPAAVNLAAGRQRTR